LYRFYDVDEGSITIDGRDIRSLNSSYLRDSVLGYINQEPTLFATSIMENIRYGKQEATDEEVKNKTLRLMLLINFTCNIFYIF
jgi:ATP-binding cassette subfamily B (MDR/TAP) protein 8